MVNFNSKFAFRGHRYLQNPKIFIASQEYQEILADFGEQLLLFGKISIKVERENAAAVILINELGLNQFYDLIDSGILEFLLWKPTVFINLGPDGKGEKDERLLIGHPPIVTGRYDSERHIDPFHSALDVVKHSTQNLKKKEKRKLVKHIEKHTRVIDFEQDPCSIVIEAYENNYLKDLGLPFNLPPVELSLNDRRTLQGLAVDVLETAILAKYQYSSLNEYKYSMLTKSALESIKNAQKLDANFDQIIHLEGLVDIKSYILAKKLSLDSILKIRKKGYSRKFRGWLEKVSVSQDAQEITQEYLNAIEDNPGFFNSSHGKFTRTISLLGLEGVGEVLTGFPGVGLVVSLFDQFVLDSFLKGWNPRLVIKDLKQNIQNE